MRYNARVEEDIALRAKLLREHKTPVGLARPFAVTHLEKKCEKQPLST